MNLGVNVFMGKSATISYNQVSDKPYIPTVPAYITSTKITSTSIESPNILGGTITIGSGNNVWKADTQGIYLGNSTFANAPFKVTMDGKLTALNGTFKGTIDGSTITGSTIRTAGTDSDRLELSGKGLTSYNAVGEKNGVAIDSGNFSSVDFYYRGTYRGGIGQSATNLTLSTTMGSIIVSTPQYSSTIFRGEVDFTDANVKGITAVFG